MSASARAIHRAAALMQGVREDEPWTETSPSTLSRRQFVVTALTAAGGFASASASPRRSPIAAAAVGRR